MLPTQNRDLDMKQFILFAAALTAISTSAQNETLTLAKELDFSDFTKVGFCLPGNECFEVSKYTDGPTFHTLYDKNLNEIASIADIEKQQIDNADGDNVYFTQAFFNNDSEIEYIITKQESVNEYDHTLQGFKIMQTNGNCFADIDIDIPKTTIETVDYYLWQIGDQYYLNVEITYPPTSDFKQEVIQQIYKIDRNASNKALTLVKSTKAYPNPVEQGKPFTINGLKNALGANIFVNNMNGTTVLSSVCNENDKAVINTEKLTSGNYLYSIINNGNTIASGKLIIK